MGDFITTGENLTEDVLVSDCVSQVYVIHHTGLVMLTRKYSSGCVSNDPQLIGGFLAALLTFAKNSYNVENQSCEWEEDGVHKLTDIGMSCSRWFITSVEEYTIAVLIPNQSPLLQQRKFELIDSICEQTISTFLIFQMFDMNVDQKLENIRDYSDDFGNTVDNIVFESLTDFLGTNLKFEIGGEVEIFDSVIG
ncbi:MAG: hypothetical protein ACXAD7_11585 [Candidatus Kariarchaeaceae archaeon]|jgi:hypothetical protein